MSVIPAQAGDVDERAEIWRFARTSLEFVTGLVLVVAAADALLGARNARRHGRAMIGSEVCAAIEAPRGPGYDMTTLVMGGSVARQLFRPGTEIRGDVLYPTSNYAISVAGQYYLLEEALQGCPNLREVDLILVVESLGHDLGPARGRIDPTQAASVRGGY